MDLDSYLKTKLDSLKEKNEYRSLVIPEGFLDFSSNDYLGLAKEVLPDSNVQLGSTGSRLRLNRNFTMCRCLPVTLAV